LQKFPDMNREHVCGAIGGFFMLRFINPAIATPNAHMLVEGKLSPIQRRNVTIIAKILQNLSNNISFGGVKEAYMTCLNPVLEKNSPILNSFLDSLTKVDDLEQRLMSQYVALTKFFDPTVITLSLNELYFMHELLWNYREKVFAGLDDDEVYYILQSFGKVPEKVSRQDNANVDIKLIVISQRADAQPSVVELEQLYGEVKYQVFRIFSMLPQKDFNAYVAKNKSANTTTVLNLLKTVQTWASKSKHQKEIAHLTESALAKIKTLLSHEILSEADDLGRLRRDIAGDVRHIESRIKRTEASIEQLRQVQKSLEDSRAESDAQMQVYAEYLSNVRVSATKSSKKTKITKKDQKKTDKGGEESQPAPKGPFKFSHSQLVKEGLIVGCSLPEKIASSLTYHFSEVPGKSGVYQAAAYWGKKSFDSATITLSLEDLLERQSLNETEMDCDALVLNVNLVIRLINKYFL